MDYKYEIRGGYIPEAVKTPLVVDKKQLIESIDTLCDISVTSEVYIKRVTSSQQAGELDAKHRRKSA